MSDNQDYLRTGSKTFRLRADISLLMLKGASYAAIFCFVCVVAIWALASLGKLLPPESRETDDPTPYSFHQIVQDTDLA